MNDVASFMQTLTNAILKLTVRCKSKWNISLSSA